MLCRTELAASSTEDGFLFGFGQQRGCVLRGAPTMGKKCSLRSDAGGFSEFGGPDTATSLSSTPKGYSHMGVSGVGISMLCDFQHHELDERQCLLQGFLEAAQTSSETKVEIWETGSRGGQDGEENTGFAAGTGEGKSSAAGRRGLSRGDRLQCSTVVPRESSGLSMQTELYEEDSVAARTAQDKSVCLRLVLQKTDTHMDEYGKLASEGHNWHRTMRRTVSDGGVSDNGTVVSRIQAGQGIFHDENWDGMESTEVCDARQAAKRNSQSSDQGQRKRLKTGYNDFADCTKVKERIILRPEKRRKTVSEQLRLSLCNRLIP